MENEKMMLVTDWNLAQYIFWFCTVLDGNFADYCAHDGEELSIAEYVYKYRFDDFKEWYADVTGYSLPTVTLFNV